MADYTPKFDGDTITLVVSADVTGGRMGSVSGDGTVATAGAKAAAWVGIFAHDALAGQAVTVHKGGIQRPVASGAITAGDTVVTAATGKVATLAAVTTPTPADVTDTRAKVGTALTTAADGETVLVVFDR